MGGKAGGRRRSPRQRRFRIGIAAATIVAALIGAVALVVTEDDSGPLVDRGGSKADASSCENASIVGENIDVDCSARAAAGAKGESVVQGALIPVECSPAAEALRLKSAMTIEVRVWCSQAMLRRDAVETKLKVWAHNPTAEPVDVSLEGWYLLVPGASSARRWSAPAGYRRPKILSLPEGRVTAIPANPDGAAEQIIGDEYNFATHWSKTQLEPGEHWQPPRFNPDGSRYLDGTLVFYVPLVHRHGDLYAPRVLGLARVAGKKVLAICPIGRWGPRVSASAF